MTPSQAARDAAAKLTDAQKEALTSGACAVPRSNVEWTADCICNAGRDVIKDLHDAGLGMHRDRFPNGFILTPLGQQVAAILKGAS